MASHGYALFETPIGRCGIVWSARGIAGLQLPEARAADTRGRVAQRFPGVEEVAPPSHAKRAIERVQRLLRGERGARAALAGIALDMDRVPPFHRRVYELARTIPPGTTWSYGELAARLGSPGASRAVGQALGKNPFAIVVPCHRVLGASGRVGGFSAHGGVGTKLRMLAIEGASVPGVDGGGVADAPRRPPRLASSEPRRAPRPPKLPYDARRAVAHLRAADPRLAEIIDAVGPLRLELKETSSLFLALAEAIVYQQLHAKAAATIFGRVSALYPRAPAGPTPERILRTPPEKLRAAGLSEGKRRAIEDLARKTKQGLLPTMEEARAMMDDAVVERLSAVRGIGRWTAEMVLIFRLGRPDVLPLDDFGIKKGFAVAFAKGAWPSRTALEERGARWRPYRSVASWYLWRMAEPPFAPPRLEVR